MTELPMNPKREDAWKINFDPIKSQEIHKASPASVAGLSQIGRVEGRVGSSGTTRSSHEDTMKIRR